MTDGVIDREQEERFHRRMDRYLTDTTPSIPSNVATNTIQTKSKEKSDPYTPSEDSRSKLVSINIAEYLNIKRDLCTIDKRMELQKIRGETKTDEYKANEQKRKDLINIAGMKALSIIANCLEQYKKGDKLTDEQKDPKNRKLTRTEAIESKFADFREALRELHSLDNNKSSTEAHKHNKREEIIDNFIKSLGDFADSYIAVGNEKILLKDFIRSSIDEVKDFIVDSKVDKYVCEILNPTVGLVKNKGVYLRKINDYISMCSGLNDDEKGLGSYMLYSHQTLQQWREKALTNERYREYLEGNDGILKKNEKLTEDNTKTIVLGSAGVGGSMAVAALPIFPIALIIALVAYCSYANKDKNPLGSALASLKKQGEECLEAIDKGFKTLSTDIKEEKKKIIDGIIDTFLSGKKEEIDKLVKAMKDTGINKFGDSLSSEQIERLDRLQKFYMKYTLDKPEYAHLLDNSSRSVSIPQIPLTNEQIKDPVFRTMQKKNISSRNNHSNPVSSTQTDDDMWQAKNRSRQQTNFNPIRTTSLNA